MIGRTIGKYRIVDRLGRGGMGTVYKAVDETLEREVAIKVLNPDLNDTDVLKRFRAEAVTLARLNHPGIATLYELARHDDDLLMVMEFVRGETFHDVSERLGPLDPPQAAHLCMQVLDALGHAHKAGVVHRDLKPANLMVTEHGVVKVMDFGIARVLGTEQYTQAGYMMGTPAYMAPEQVTGHTIDGRADLYAIGVVFYRLLTGRLPFEADTAISMAQKQIAEAPTPVATFRPDLPAWCARVIERALAKSPGDRFQSAEDFRMALLSAVQPQTLGELPTMATPTPPGIRLDSDLTATRSAYSTTAPPPPASSEDGRPTTVVLRRTHLAAIAAAIIVVLVGIGLLAYTASRRGSLSEQLQALGAEPPATEPSEPADPDRSTQPASGDAGESDSAAASGETAGAPAGSAPAPAAAERGVAATAGGTAAGSTPGGSPRPAPSGGGAAAGSSKPDPTLAKDDRGAKETAVPAAERERPADANLAPVTFREVRVLVEENGRPRERQSVLQLAEKQVTLLDRDDGGAIASVPYSSIVGVFYSRSKQPKWRDGDGNEVVSKIDLGPLGFFRGERNWLILLTRHDPLIIRLEDAGLRTILPAIQARTGATIQR